jgi:hypothetical protein
MRRRRVLPLLIASAAHVALLASLARVKIPEPPKNELRAPPEKETEIEIRLEEPARAPKDETDTPRAAEESAREIARVERPPAPRPGDESPAEPSTVPPSGPASEDWTFSPTAPRSVDLGLGSGARRSGVTGPALAAGRDGRSPAEGATPKGSATSATGGVAEALSAADVSLGMVRGGSVLTAAEEATRADPVVGGDATFEVVMWRDGTSDVRMVDATGDTDEWQRIASTLASQVKGRNVRIASGADGLRVTVHLEASWKLADGRDLRSLHGPRAAVEPSVLQQALAANAGHEPKPGPEPVLPDHGSGGQKETPAVGGELGTGKEPPLPAVIQGIAQRVLPTPTVSVTGKVCSATLSVTPLGVGIGGGCSVENIGTPATHAVSGRIVREEALKRTDAGARGP